MLDGIVRRAIDPPLNVAGQMLAARGVSADVLTGLGLLAGLAGAAAVVGRVESLALVLVLASRLLDGLDGAVARAKTHLTRYLALEPQGPWADRARKLL